MDRKENNFLAEVTVAKRFKHRVLKVFLCAEHIRVPQNWAHSPALASHLLPLENSRWASSLFLWLT